MIYFLIAEAEAPGFIRFDESLDLVGRGLFCRNYVELEVWFTPPDNVFVELCRTSMEYLEKLETIANTGAPGAIRTPDLRNRNPSLYPAELRVRGGGLDFLINPGIHVNERVPPVN